jgi:hypothetical protein
MNIRVWLFQKRHLFSQSSTNAWAALIYFCISAVFATCQVFAAQKIFPANGKNYSEVYVWTAACNVAGNRGFSITLAMIIPMNLMCIYLTRAIWTKPNALYYKETVTCVTSVLVILGLYLIIQLSNSEYFFSIPGFIYIHYMGIIVPCIQLIVVIPGTLLHFKIRTEQHQIRTMRSSTVNLEATLPNRVSILESKDLIDDSNAFSFPKTIQELNILHILNNKILRKAFQDYLSQEFSSENIFLWRALQHWFNSFGEAGRLFDAGMETEEHFQNREKGVKSAIKIYEQFIPSTAPLMVNISSRRSNGLNSFFEESISQCTQSRDVFEALIAEFRDLEQEVVKTMSDSFYRFLITTECKAAFGEAQKL